MGDGHLVERLLVHEDVVFSFFIEELVGTAFYTDIFQLFTDVEAAFQYVAVYYVFQFRTHESISLPGFYMQEVDAEIQFAVHADACADFNVLGINHIL